MQPSPWIDGLTIGRVLEEAARRFPGRDALVFPQNGVRMSYGEFAAAVRGVAKGLLAMGVKPGEHVGIWATNLPEWVLLQYAAASVGVVLVTINPAYRPFELRYTLEQSDIVALFLTDRFKTSDYYAIFEEANRGELTSPACGGGSEASISCKEIVSRAVGESSSSPLHPPAPGYAVGVRDGATGTAGLRQRESGGNKTSLASAAPPQGGISTFPKLRHTVALKPGAPGGFYSWQGMVQAGKRVPDSELEAIARTLKTTDVINIQYTSGTTGFPKAAMLTHRNILMNAWYVTGCQNITEADRMCIPVPFYHCFGCVMGSLGAVTRGAAMVIPAEYFNAAATLETIEKERCTTVYGVPTMFVAMLADESFARRGLSSLRSGIMAGSPCPIEVMKKVIDVMGCREITIAYGQTETSPVLTQSRVDDSIELRVETVGRELPGVEIKIVDPETDQPVTDNVQGELCARGHGIMLGYYKNPEATAHTIRNGWVHTGDLAIRRPDGYYKITGRLKDMVIRGGENVYPREIEEFLFTHPAVSQAAVFGVPDSKFGEELCAWVQLHPGKAASEEEIRAFCKASLAHYKVPRYVKFVAEFPATVSGKIQKFKMRETMCAELGLKEQKTA